MKLLINLFEMEQQNKRKNEQTIKEAKEKIQTSKKKEDSKKFEKHV
jgi:hypothetical protein